MKVFRALDAVPPLPNGSVLAIGNFDGLHRGHRRILRVLTARARDLGLPSCILTFSPHPERVFGSRRIAMIQTLDQRLDGLAAAGADMTLVLPFDRTLARQPAEAFVREVLVGALLARRVVVGEGFRFGRSREGGLALLRRLGKTGGFGTEAVPPVRWKGRTVSSSLIRDLLAAGCVGSVRALLGRPFELEGDVVRGDARGKRLGFPTANIATPNEILPPGIFFTTFCVDGDARPALTSVGVRPTFGRNAVSIETYILDFEKDIYGEAVTVRFHRKLRDERAYPDERMLVARLRRDRDAAARYFAAAEAAAKARPLTSRS
jgi:riboflavin kinase/FMN adenylyltransferase